MKKLTPMRAIRGKCLDCCCGSPAEVRMCPAENCPLHPYRFGKRPGVGDYTPGNATAEKSPANPVADGAEGRESE